MIEFTVQMVVKRWSDIFDYFSLLIGHRNSLPDPDAHDSLLFDDDSFSRSRRYFWAINYLAELDISITRNIAQLEAWIVEWPHHLHVSKKGMSVEARTLPERMEQLKAWQGKLRALRQETINLRDGVSLPLQLRVSVEGTLNELLLCVILKAVVLTRASAFQRKRCYRKQSSYTTW
jgi:hypothetical protein